MLPSEDPDSKTQDSQWTFGQRYGLLLVAVSPILANAVGSVFNILYNQTQVEPLLSETQMARFNDCWKWFNLAVYPVAIACFLVPLSHLYGIHQALLRGDEIDALALQTARRRVINLPWWFLTIASIGWFSCIPVFPAALYSVPEPLSIEVVLHLITSFVVASMIAVTHSFFAVELVVGHLLFPVYFQDATPASIPGGRPLGITARGVFWAFSAVVSPVVSLVLILLVPDAAQSAPAFAIAVGIVAILFGLTTSWMLGKLVATPINRLKQAAVQVASGNLDTRVNLLRADDFGLLIDRFNLMVEGLKEREHLNQVFGQHVGREVAKQIMDEDGSLSGRNQTITVMFVDVRNFTKFSSSHTPEQVVAGLNLFFREAVEQIESHGGLVNKFLGDGLMAFFGIGTETDNHAYSAVDAGIKMLDFLDQSSALFAQVGWADMKIGIGINTGPAVVGSIGAPQRREYTAIGDTVNVAARVESLTKELGEPLVITEATRLALDDSVATRPLPPQYVKGKDEPIKIHGIC